MYFENFNRLVNACGTTYSHVSQETGISKATISAWKKGDYTPKIDKLQKIADYFNVSLDELLDVKTTTDETSQRVLEIVSKIKNLPEDQQKLAYAKILGYIDGLSDNQQSQVPNPKD